MSDNTDNRIGVLSNVVAELANIVASQSPTHIQQQIYELMKAWDKAEDKYPLPIDNEPPTE